MKLCLTLLATVVALSGRYHALAAPGELDGGFGRNGLAISRGAYGMAAVQQADDKLLIAASSWAGLKVWRLNPDGLPDRGFANNGMADVPFPQRGEARDVDLALMADGRIVIVGTLRFESSSLFAIARLRSDGTLDESFDGDGRVTIDTGHSWQSLSSVVAGADGRIVVAGALSGPRDDDMAFFRLLHDGALDPTFGNGAVPGTTIVDSGLNDYPNELIAMPDGHYVACGYAQIDELVYVGTMLAVRLNHDGSLDRGFGAEGFARLETAARGYSSAAEGCLALSNGSLVLAGWELRDAGRPAVVLMRLRPDGVRDRGAWSDGLATPDLGRANAHAIVEIDGGFAISGAANLRTSRGVSASDAYIARVDGLSGSLDRGFGHDGVTTTDFDRYGGFATESVARALLRQADGKLVMAGGTWFMEGWDVWPEITVARIDPGGVGYAGMAGFVEPIVWIGTEATAIFTVRRTGGSSGTLLVDFETLNGSALAPRDYTAVRGTLTWADGDVEPKTIEVPITPGAVPSVPQEKRFDVLLSTSSGALARYRAWACIGNGCNEVALSATPAYSGAAYGGSSASPGRVSGGGAAGTEALLLLVAAWLSSRRRQGKFRRCMNDA